MSFFTRHPWWAVIPVILLALALGSPRLDSEGLWYDEMWSVYVAGGAHLGPLTPEGILQRVLWQDSTQGYGYPLLLGGWGALAGWSEYSIRVLAMFGGLLAVAMAYRLGHDVQRWSSVSRSDPNVGTGPALSARSTPPVSAALHGVLAAMILAVSAFFVWYLHEGRVYAIVVFLGLTTVWCYLRLLCVPQARVGLMALFVLSAAGLLYANYFAVVLLAGMAVYHLLINPYGRAQYIAPRVPWWRLVFLAVCAGAMCLPTIYGIRGGVAMYNGWDDVRNRALSLPELTRVFGHFLSHDAYTLLIGLLLIGLVWGWRQGPALRGLLLITLFSLITVYGLQWRTQIIEFTKFRYVIVLWGLLAVVIAAGMVGIGVMIGPHVTRLLSPNRPPTNTRRWGVGFAALIGLIWCVGGVHANLDPYFMTENGPPGDIPRWRTVINVLKASALPHDVYAHYSGPRARDDDMSFWFTMHELSWLPSFITISAFDPENEDWVWSQVERAWRVWYSQDLRQPITEDHTRFVQRMTDMGYSPCPTPYEDAVMRIDLYVDSTAFCPGGEPWVRFGDSAVLTGWQTPPQTLTVDQTLSLPMGWTIGPDLNAEAYSIGLYVMPDASTVAAQGDTGLPDRAFGVARVEIPLAGVMPGDYGLYMAVYEWNGPNALPAQNLRTGETSPRLIRVGSITVKNP